MTFSSVIIPIISGIIGTIGFAILFNSEPKRLPVTAIGAFVSCLLYFLLLHYTSDELLSNFISAFVSMIYFEIAARAFKAPVIIFLIPGLIPLVPGRALYYTMSNAIGGNMTEFLENGLATIKITAGIAGGIIFSSLAISCLTNQIKLKK